MEQTLGVASNAMTVSTHLRRPRAKMHVHIDKLHSHNHHTCSCKHFKTCNWESTSGATASADISATSKNIRMDNMTQQVICQFFLKYSVSQPLTTSVFTLQSLPTVYLASTESFDLRPVGGGPGSMRDFGGS